MSGIPYNRLQTVEVTAKTDNGETVVIETLHYAYIVPCRDCRYYEPIPEDSGDWCGYWTDRIYADARGSGFCAWGEREDGDAR